MQTGSCIKGPAFAKMADARTRCSSLILLLLVLNGTEIFAKEILTNIWAVKIPGGQLEAKQVASKNDFLYSKQVSLFLNLLSIVNYQI